LKGVLVARDARGSSFRVLVFAGWAVVTAVCGGIRAGLSRFAIRACLGVPRPRRKAPSCAPRADGCCAGFGPAPCRTYDAGSCACRRCWHIAARDAVRAGCARLRSGGIPDGKRRGKQTDKTRRRGGALTFPLHRRGTTFGRTPLDACQPGKPHSCPQSRRHSTAPPDSRCTLQNAPVHAQSFRRRTRGTRPVPAMRTIGQPRTRRIPFLRCGCTCPPRS